MAGKSGKPAAGEAEQRVQLPEDCRMTALSGVRTELLAVLAHPVCTLDATAVARVDTAAIQLLVAFQRAAGAAGRTVRWQGVGAPLREAAALLGLEQTLQLPA
ncbi:MAG TPA: STAS domain-containing protein [Dyella sp.]|uniref:STAS domain-containing protein n=1 Tax=Dyella sp. TaxID=1869338 RepID=UPI002F94A279